jgi:hypothetical protein
VKLFREALQINFGVRLSFVQLALTAIITSS